MNVWGVWKTRVFHGIVLWGALKEKVYCNNPATIGDLKNNIRMEVANISAETLVKVFQNFESRLRFCSENEGDHFEKMA